MITVTVHKESNRASFKYPCYLYTYNKNSFNASVYMA